MPVPKIIISSGEPAGIGPDLISSIDIHQYQARIIIIGDQSLIKQRAKKHKSNFNLISYSNNQAPEKPCLEIIHQPLAVKAQAGKLNAQNAHYVLKLIKIATQGCLNNEFDAMVTAPIQKDIINTAGVPFTGHTEYLAKLCDAPLPVMMLASNRLRVALVTTHLPIKEVANEITAEKISSIAHILSQDLSLKFGIKNPHIKICGLNPHAGENGYLGMEEIEIISPCIKQLNKSINVSGPYPADTVFTQQHLKDADVVLAMYHDQGLPVLKHASFGNAINTTLGLPIIRTSVDHGTALDKAGTKEIDSGSLDQAIKSAIEQVKHFHHKNNN